MEVTEKKKAIQTKITDYLSKQQDIMFAYLFGSFVDKERYRDVDVGIYMDSYPDLIRLGSLQAGLDKLLKGIKVDLVLLNKVPQKNPTLGFQVINRGNLLLNKNRRLHINKNRRLHNDFKNRTVFHYFDTAHLRKKMEQAFSDRVRTGKFAVRNQL